MVLAIEPSGAAPLVDGRYRLGARLGAGAAGAVYEIHGAGPQRLAIKLMLPQWAGNTLMVRRFEREIETLQAIVHPNIVPILDHGQLADGRLWYVMPRLEGTDLDAMLVACGRLGLDEALLVMDAVCAALGAAHRCGVIHRDLKASNVFVGTGEPACITLLDFGAARVDTSTRGHGLTAAGTAVGTPTSMAPEQVVGLDSDARTDVYAAGVLLFRMLTGRYPFEDGTADEIMLDHLSTPPPRPSDIVAVPAAVERVILRCLEKRPEQRFADAGELAAALQEMRGGATARSSATTRAIAVHVDLTGAEAIVDAHGLDALELAASRLDEAGLELAFGVGSGVLAVAPLDGAIPAALARAAELAHAVAEAIVRDIHPDLAPRIVLHVGDTGATPQTGSIGAIDEWAAIDLPAGIHLSPAARAARSAERHD